jgi:hypothetical protein
MRRLLSLLCCLSCCQTATATARAQDVPTPSAATAQDSAPNDASPSALSKPLSGSDGTRETWDRLVKSAHSRRAKGTNWLALGGALMVAGLALTVADYHQKHSAPDLHGQQNVSCGNYTAGTYDPVAGAVVPVFVPSECPGVSTASVVGGVGFGVGLVVGIVGMVKRRHASRDLRDLEKEGRARGYLVLGPTRGRGVFVAYAVSF